MNVKKKATCDGDKCFVVILNCIRIIDLCMHTLPQRNNA